MKVSVKNSGICRKTMTVEVPVENVKEEREKLLKYYAKGVAIPGFRKGKAPKELVEKKFAKELDADLKDRLLPKYYQEAIKSKEVKVVSIVDVSEPALEDGKPLTFNVTMDVSPQFKLPKYHGIPIRAEPVEVADEQVDETLGSILRQNATFEDIGGRPAKENDMVQVAYEATVEGDLLEEKVPEARGMGKGNGYWITCDNQSFLPGMGQALIGTSIGDKKEIAVEFPADFIVKELAEMKAVYQVEVTGMRESRMPKMDEEFLKKMRVDSEEELRSNIRQHLTEAAETKEKRRREDTVCEFLLKKTKLDVPETAVQNQTRTLMYEMVRMRMMQGMTQDQISAQSADMIEEAKVKAEEQVKLRYIVMEIADAEEIQVSEDEVSDEIVRMAIQQQRDADQFREELEKEDQMDSVSDQIRFGKTMEFLIENAKIK